MKYAIAVDDREQAGGLPEALARLGLAPKMRRLAVGDIAIGARLIIERKEVADFMASWRDGRLAGQLGRMGGVASKGAVRCVMIVEGELNNAALPGVPVEEMREAILSVMFDWGMTVIQTEGVQETALWVAALARREEKLPAAIGTEYRATNRATPPAGLARRKPPVRGTEALQIAALGKLPGVGSVKARALLEHFGSMSVLQRASDEEWGAVSGIGEGVVEILRRHFGQR